MKPTITFTEHVFTMVHKMIVKTVFFLLFAFTAFTAFSQTKYYSSFANNVALSHEVSTASQVSIPVVGTVALGAFTAPQNVSDLDTTNSSSYASAAVVITALASNINLLSGLSVNVQADINLASYTSTFLNGGSVAGFLIDNTGGLVNVNLGNTITLSTYLNNVLVESTTSPTVTQVPSISSTAQDLHFTTSSGKNFNQVRISLGSALLGANLLATTKFYYSYGITPPQVLPISLLSFNGILEGQSVKLVWATALESNSSYFKVQSSVDGIAFTDLGTVSAAGTSTISTNYTYIDKLATGFVVYYRIKSVDKDGSTMFSNIIAVKLNISNPLKIFPNPVTNLVNIETGTSGIYTAELFTVGGKKVESAQLSTASGLATFNINRVGIPTGVYLLRVTSNSSKISSYSTIFLK